MTEQDPLPIETPPDESSRAPDADPSGAPTPDRPADGSVLENEPSAAEEIEIDTAAEAASALIEGSTSTIDPMPLPPNGDPPVSPLPPPLPVRAPAPQTPIDARLAVDHVAERVRAYPGEEVTLFTRIRVLDKLSGLLLRIELPEAVEIVAARGPEAAGLPATEVGADKYALRWEVGDSRALDADTVLLFETVLRIPPVMRLSEETPVRDEVEMHSHAAATAPAPDGRMRQPVGESAVIMVRAKGSYLRYLPAVYERDNFMARFLMLFESFWAPVQGQIDTLSNYFDPQIAPLTMVRWWADRMDLAMDEDWPEEAQRRMVQQAVHLFRRRGTRLGLEQLLEAYTGAHAEIVERRANNFRLGAGARLGQGVALGARNQPHSFSVFVRLPSIPEDPQQPGHAERRRARRRDRIRALIEVEKPAHVTYTLDIDEVDA